MYKMLRASGGWKGFGGWKTKGNCEWKICNDENGGENQKRKENSIREGQEKKSVY